MPECCEIEFGGATLTLTGDRAVWWEAERTLLLSDLHLGKPASFREKGAPVPEEVTATDLARVSSLVERFDAAHLLILGDLAHDRAAWREVTLDAFAAWRAAHASLGVTLVRGNHDRWADDPPCSLGIGIVEPGWTFGGLAMHHEPPVAASRPALCGHLHPGVRLHPAGRTKRPGMRTPCYWFSRSLGVLPAFGRFTGCAMIRPRERDRVFVVGNGQVIEMTDAQAA